MSIDLLTDRLPINAQRALTYLNYVILLAFLLFVIVYGTQLAWTSRARSFQGIPWISYSWVTASLPSGALLLMLTTVVKIVDLRQGRRVVPSAG